jgi:phosphoheptose isomerase
MNALHDHVDALRSALDDLDVDRVGRWGTVLARSLLRGQRLLVAGNGGSAAHAQHFSAELVGRYRTERLPLSAIALHAETSTITAVANDYGFDAVYSRQVRAHGRPGDLLLLVSTSGSSPNLVAAARAARDQRLVVWALTGLAPNPLSRVADDTLAVSGSTTATVQEVHQVVVHLLCEVVDRCVSHATVAPAEAARGDCR